MNPTAALVAVAAAFALAGCSGGAGESVEPQPAAPPGSLGALWSGPGEAVTAVAGTSDHGVGSNRISFLAVTGASELVERPTAEVWLAWGRNEKPFATTTARLEPVGVPGGLTADAQHIYVFTVDVDRPGVLWYLAQPDGGTPIQVLGTVKIARRTTAPTIGDNAVETATPTLRSTGGDIDDLTTSRVPDRALYEHSVAESLADGVPFVVSFATPQFCQTRVCGPVVEIVTAARKRLAGSDVRFLHVEIYEDNEPGKGVNRWVKAWQLPTEPFTFVVDRTGVITARFEGAFSVDELVAAARAVE